MWSFGVEQIKYYFLVKRTPAIFVLFYDLEFQKKFLQQIWFALEKTIQYYWLFLFPPAHTT